MSCSDDFLTPRIFVISSLFTIHLVYFSVFLLFFTNAHLRKLRHDIYIETIDEELQFGDFSHNPHLISSPWAKFTEHRLLPLYSFTLNSCWRIHRHCFTEQHSQIFISQTLAQAVVPATPGNGTVWLAVSLTCEDPPPGSYPQPPPPHITTPTYCGLLLHTTSEDTLCRTGVHGRKTGNQKTYLATTCDSVSQTILSTDRS